MANLTLKNVSKVYSGSVRAVSEVSAEIPDGEFVILVGPSGCGKSTLLRMIAGLEEISSGEISIDNRVVNQVHAKDRDIAFVFQNYALYPHMTVGENMAFGLKMRKFAKDEIAKRVADAADILGLTEYLNRKPGALSGGQRQRVAVGRAIVRQPKLFLFDEPLSNLDAKMRVTMRAELIKLHKQLKASKMPATVVYVTHDQVEAMSMGNRLVVMKDGLVQQVGAPLEIYNNPANQFVAGFIGSPPMNFLKAELQQRGDSSFVVGNGFELKLPRKFAGHNRQVVFGIRPEDIHERGDQVSTASSSESGFLSAKVEVLEPLGGEVIATCSFGGNEITVRLSPRTLAQSDAMIELTFDVERAKLFDPATGEALV